MHCFFFFSKERRAWGLEPCWVLRCFLSGFLGFALTRHGHAVIRIVAVGGEGFRAVEQPMIAVANGGRSRPARVRARLRLRQRPRPHRFPPSPPHKGLLSLRLRVTLSKVA